MQGIDPLICSSWRSLRSAAQQSSTLFLRFVWSTVQAGFTTAAQPNAGCASCYKSALTSWVVFGMQILQASPGNMGVDLGCGKVTVTKQHLHHPQVRAMVQQMRGERVT